MREENTSTALTDAELANPNLKDKDGNTALHFVARRGELNAVALLIEKGADINAKNARGETPLYRAAEGGHVNVIKCLRENGADMKVQCDGVYFTPLHCAVRENQFEAVEFLVKNGADVNAHRCGQTPLWMAVSRIHPDMNISLPIIECLLKNGADANIKHASFNDSPLHGAVRRICSLDIIKCLVENGAKLGEKNKEGKTPLQLVVDNNQGEGEWSRRRNDAVDFLIRSICEAATVYPGGFYALLEACNNNSQVINKLRAWLVENKISIAARLGDHEFINAEKEIPDALDVGGHYSIDRALRCRDAPARGQTIQVLFNKGCRNSVILERHGCSFKQEDDWKKFAVKVKTFMEKPRGSPVRAMLIFLALRSKGIPSDVIKMILSYAQLGENPNLGRFGFSLIPTEVSICRSVNRFKIQRWLEAKKSRLTSARTSAALLRELIVFNNPKNPLSLTLAQLFEELKRFYGDRGTAVDAKTLHDMEKMLMADYDTVYLDDGKEEADLPRLTG